MTAEVATPQAPDSYTALELRFSLIAHRINARFTQIANKLLNRQGISMYDSRILLFLLDRQEMRVGDLVEAMALPQSTMSHQLKQLQVRRLIRRRRSRRDNRSVVVTLTPAGEEIARACERYSTAVQSRIIESFTASETDQLIGLLQTLFGILDVASFSPDQSAADASPPPKGMRRVRGMPSRARRKPSADRGPTVPRKIPQ